MQVLNASTSDTHCNFEQACTNKLKHASTLNDRPWCRGSWLGAAESLCDQHILVGCEPHECELCRVRPFYQPANVITVVVGHVVPKTRLSLLALQYITSTPKRLVFSLLRFAF